MLLLRLLRAEELAQVQSLLLGLLRAEKQADKSPGLRRGLQEAANLVQHMLASLQSPPPRA